MLVVAAWTVVLQGCYQSLPLQQGVAPTAARVELVLNDQGRATLAERLGPMVEKVDGHVLSQSADAYTVAVARIAQLNGNSVTWNGERVEVRREHVNGYQVRRLSTTRTVALAVVVSVAVVFIFFGKSLVGGGTDDKPDPAVPIEPTRVHAR